MTREHEPIVIVQHAALVMAWTAVVMGLLRVEDRIIHRITACIQLFCISICMHDLRVALEQ